MNLIAPKPLCEFVLPGKRVRMALPEDVGEVLRLFVENLWLIAQFPPDADTVAHEIWAAVHERRVFVVESDGEIVGCAAYALLRPWYLAKPQLWDQGIFVIPSERKTRAAYLLKKALEDEAARLDVTAILSANTKNPEAAAILAKRHRKVADVFVVRE